MLARISVSDTKTDAQVARDSGRKLDIGSLAELATVAARRRTRAPG